MSNLGFIGLGIMGRPMAGHLIAGGHKLFLHGHGTSPKELLDKGAVSCSNARDVARSADIIFTMVPDTPNVENAFLVEKAPPRASRRARSLST
jgi:2-hydroxy-3-oxopropionate reductase